MLIVYMGVISQGVKSMDMMSYLDASVSTISSFHQALFSEKACPLHFSLNKGIGDAGSTADIRMLWPWSALVCLGLL